MAEGPMADDTTPIHASKTYPILRTLAEQEIARLGKFVPDSLPVIERLRSLHALLEVWSPQFQPTDEERQKFINELWDTLKEAGRIR